MKKLTGIAIETHEVVYSFDDLKYRSVSKEDFDMFINVTPNLTCCGKQVQLGVKFITKVEWSNDQGLIVAIYSRTEVPVQEIHSFRI